MDMAFQWQATMADDQVSASDRRDFIAWLKADPEHKAAYEQAKLFWQNIGTVDKAALDDDFFRASLSERVRSFIWRGMKAIVNCIPQKPAPVLGSLGGVCVLLLLGILYLPTLPPVPDTTAAVYRTTVGERRTINLQDGSRIELGPDTTVEVRLQPDARMVEMGLGEAFFQVAKDANRPFTVTSGELLVTVRGTAFDVRRSTENASVSVAEGVVSVTRTQPANKQAQMLTSGERLTLRIGDNDLQVAEVKPESVAAWRDDRLIYIDAPLSDIVTDINRYQSRKIRIRDKELAKIRITATFNSNDIDGMLGSLSELFPIRIKRGANSTELHRSM